MSEADYSTIGGGDFPPDAKTLIFRGISGTECEYFIRCVRFIALAEGKDELRPRWMLRFATARFAGQALRWHARLDREIRGDWDRLVQALLNEYAADFEDETPVARSIGMGTIPSLHMVDRAAAVPPGPGLHMGRVRVVPKLGPPVPLYLSRNHTLKLTTEKADALHVQFMQSSEPHVIDILKLEYNQYDYHKRYFQLTMVFHQLAIEVRQSGPGTIFIARSSYRPSDMSRSALHMKCWRLGPDNALEVIINGSASDAAIQPQTLIISRYHECFFLNNYELWLAESPDAKQTHYEARLVFEPLAEPFD